MLEPDLIACLLRNADMYKYALFELSKTYYKIHEELGKKGVQVFRRSTLAHLLKDA